MKNPSIYIIFILSNDKLHALRSFKVYLAAAPTFATRLRYGSLINIIHCPVFKFE